MEVKWRDGGGQGSGVFLFIKDIDYNGISKMERKKKNRP